VAGDEQIRIDITAEDDASKVLEDVADDAAELEKLSPEIDVSADTDAATAGIRDVVDAAQTLSKQDTEIVLRARIDDAKGQLKDLRSDLEQTGDKAEDTARRLDKVGGDTGGGIQSRGNAIADLTGPLGEASSAASDFAGVMDGLGDLVGDAASKMGASAETVGRISSAMGVAGIAIAAGATAWSLFSAQQRKAKEEAQKLLETQRKLTDAIRDGNREVAATSFREIYPEADRAVGKLGVGIRAVTEYITGQKDEVAGLAERLAVLRERYDDGTTAGQLARLELDQISASLIDARQRYNDTNGEIGHAVTVTEQYARALGVTTDEIDKGTDATADNTDEVETNTTAQEKLQRKLELTRQGFEKIRGVLDMDTAAANFRTVMEDALFWVRHGADLTDEHIRDIKGAILDVAEYAGYTPIEVRSLLERIDNGDVDAVVREVNHRLESNAAKAKVDLHPPTASEYAAMNREIQRGLGIVYFTAQLNALRSGAYG
jgi:type II secretory pathway pseudopilin PulG